MTVMRYRSSAGATSRSLFCHGWPVGTKTTSSRPKRTATSLAATRCPWWIGSNVPPITPIRRPATDRAYPGGAGTDAQPGDVLERPPPRGPRRACEAWGEGGPLSERGDEVRELGGVAALDHVDHLAVAVGRRVAAAPQPARLGVEPVRRAGAADQVGQHRQPRRAIVGAAVPEHEQRRLRPDRRGPTLR